MTQFASTVSFDSFVVKATAVHKGRYRYLSLVKEGLYWYATFICPVHGEVRQERSNHLKSHGCGACGNALQSVNRQKALEARQAAARSQGRYPWRYSDPKTLDWTQEPMKSALADAEARGRASHGDKYDYLSLHTEGRYLKLTMRCPEHGEFVQTADNHCNGKGCAQCGGTAPYTLEDAKAEAAKFGFDYTYRELERGGRYPMLHLTCPRHGEFSQHLYNHLAGRGCEECSEEKTHTPWETLAEQATVMGKTLLREGERNAFGQRQVWLNCDEHGEYLAAAANLTKGYDCKACADKERGERARWTLEEFAETAARVHNGKFWYTAVEFKDDRTFVTAHCSKHGEFKQATDSHLRGQGCPVCKFGAAEQSLKTFVASLTEAIPEARLDPNSKMRWDVYAPAAKLAFEFNGTYWHSTKFRSPSYHRNKYNAAAAQGIRTMFIYEDEWKEQRTAVESAIRAAVGAQDQRLQARKLHVTEPTAAQAGEFLDTYHIQKRPYGAAYVGLADGDGLQAVLAFSMKRPGRGQAYTEDCCEITRYASKLPVQGGFSRLLKHVLKKHPKVETVYTFSDIRFFSGKLYASLGFVQEETLRPDYFYIKGGQRYHKANAKKDRLGGPEGMGELERAELAGLYRVYDCGKIRWRLDVKRT